MITVGLTALSQEVRVVAVATDRGTIEDMERHLVVRRRCHLSINIHNRIRIIQATTEWAKTATLKHFELYDLIIGNSKRDKNNQIQGSHAEAPPSRKNKQNMIILPRKVTEK